MGRNQFVARKRSPPIALVACDKDGLARLIGEPIERLLDGEIGASPRLRARGSASIWSTILRLWALAGASTTDVRRHHALAPWQSLASPRRGGSRRAG